MAVLSHKYWSELNYWRLHAQDTWLPWFRGELSHVFEYPCPTNPVRRYAEEWVDAVRTYSDVSLDYYPKRLDLDPAKNYGRLLDVGCGPMGCARAFVNSECWGVDPLVEEYRLIGYPLGHYGMVHVASRVEQMWMIPCNFFDAIISVNAIDHVDDFELAIAEIERVCKPDGLIRFQASYHKASTTEPLELSDERVLAAFKKFSVRKIRHSQNSEEFTETIWEKV